MDFKNVPKEYRPIPFWSWNEKMDTAETAEQVDKMCAQGIGGFFMHARGGLQTEYMGDEWFENVGVCADKCRENGMHPWAYDENGWPSGFGGGIVNGKGLKYQQKYLRCSEGECDGEHTIVNKDGYHFYYDVNPFYVDTLDGEVIKCFIDEIYKPYYDKFKGRLDGFFTDEPQISRNGIPWSLTLPEEYKKAYGDELTDRLIELFKPVGDYKTTRVRFWKLITDLFSKNFMKQIYDWCNDHGFKFTGHLVLEESLLSQLVSNGACMPHYEYFTIPGMDWLGRHNRYSLTPYQVGSVARQTGKAQVLSETFAMCGHNVGHDELKWIFEYQMVRGINLLCQHLEGYSNRGLRKRDYPPAMYIQQPWWDEYNTFNDAMSRIGMLLSGGDDGVEVLVIHPQTTAWSMYDDTKEGCEAISAYNAGFCEILKLLERKHINFHLGDETIMERHGSVDGNCLVIGNKKYSKVIVPEHEVLFENTQKLLDEFAANGGSIVSADLLDANPIIDVPQITYCERHYDDFDMYYFVNSTEETYTAHIVCGSKVMDITTGELSDFYGEHTFRKYESLVVIDDRSGVTAMYAAHDGDKKAIDLGGEWSIKECSDNAITLDYCDYYFDGVPEEKNGYILNAMYRAIDRMKPTHITCEYKVEANYLPHRLFLVCETPEIMDIFVNGAKIDNTDCGCFVDKSFRKIDVADKFVIGENVIRIEVDFCQSEQVYKNIENGKKFESEKNKLTFDMEIEQIYLVGDFSVDCDGMVEELDKNACRFGGKFVIAEPKKKIFLDKISRQGFPFFAGSITVEKEFDAADGEVIDFEKCGINVVKARVNGIDAGKFMWEPYRTEISDFVHEGKNTIELTLINNLRNLEGPFHLADGESYFVGPGSFYKEKCIWSGGTPWNDDYCFADVGITNRK